MRLFFLVILFSNISLASLFSERHVDPFLLRLQDKASLLAFVSGAGAVLLVRPNDDQIRNDWKAHQKMPLHQADVGDFLGTGAVGVAIAFGQYVFDNNEDHYQSHARSLVYQTLSTYALKYSFGRQRPGNSDSRHSFPSGHTATAFATATSLTYSYGWQVGVIAYPMAAFVGLSRLADDAHWASDVVAGAVLGVIMARASSYDHPKTVIDQTSQLNIFPVIDDGQLGGGLVYLFQ